ncbi:PDGLE domain-containing protein [Candidatus Solincola sp.]|jgi:cobalt/nickel transport protein|nr:PDGLE domain-containing protein [Actinomycetota bacterium]MDI7251973.1 PDGLE domain-containing protein [Actinomycetota bacterium]
MEARKKGIYIFILAGFLVSVALALLVSPWASSAPDGLEKVAEDKGFIEKAEETDPAWESAPIPDYAVPGLTREAVDEETGEVVEEPTKLATALAGLVGTVAIFLIAWGLALVLKKKKPEEAGQAP